MRHPASRQSRTNMQCAQQYTIKLELNLLFPFAGGSPSIKQPLSCMFYRREQQVHPRQIFAARADEATAGQMETLREPLVKGIEPAGNEACLSGRTHADGHAKS